MENRNQDIRDHLEEFEQEGEMIFALPLDLNQMSLGEQNYYRMVEQVLFMDLYKKLYYQLRTQTITEESLLLLPWVDGICQFRDIHTMFIKNKDIFASAMEATFAWTNASALEKLAQVKSLSKEKRDTLLKICPTFQEEIDIYDREVTLEDYYQYTLDIKAFYEEEKMRYFDARIEEQIASFIQSLYFYDRGNACKNILQLSLRDYIWSKEWIKKRGDFQSNFGREVTLEKMQRVQFVEQNETDDIIHHALLTPTYLKNILQTHLSIRKEQKSIEELEEKEKNLTEQETIKEKIKRMKEGRYYDYLG